MKRTTRTAHSTCQRRSAESRPSATDNQAIYDAARADKDNDQRILIERPPSNDLIVSGHVRVLIRDTYRYARPNLEAVLTQSARGRLFVTRPAERKPTGLQVQRKIEFLGRLWAEYETTHYELAVHNDDPDVADYLKDATFGQARRDYYELLEELEGLLDDTSLPPAGDHGHAATHAQAPARATTSTLERVPLPEFDGTTQGWPSFRDQFTAMVVNDASISDIFKLSYLKKSLKGNALALISHVDVINAGFEEAWKIIDEHYQNVNALTFANVVRLLKLEPADSRKAGQLERLYIETREVVASLKALKEPVETWSTILVVMTVLRLDNDLRKDWEHSLGSTNTFPTFTELEEFLKRRIHVNSLYNIKPEITRQATGASTSKLTKSDTNTKYNSHVSTHATPTCEICGKPSHRAYQCHELLKLDAKAKLSRVKSARLCVNCLSSSHSTNDCKNKYRCKHCQRRHHSILHDSSRDTKRETSAAQEKTETTPPQQVSSHAATQVAASSQTNRMASGNVLLATAIVKLSSAEGGMMTARVLIDQGSERSFISEHAAQKLRLKRTHVNATIAGIGNSTPGSVKHSAQVHIASLNNLKSINVTCLVLAKLTSYTPREHVAHCSWYHVQHLPLADIELQSHRPIEVILGADVYGAIILDGILRFPREPIAQSTIFGWILTGPVVSNDTTHDKTEDSRAVINSLHVTSNDALAKSLNQFWELEDTPAASLLTADERKCEDLFSDTTTRDSSGRYMVHLPFSRELPINIGDSYEIASKQYTRLERRLARDPALSSQYHAFLKEYFDLGHMSLYSPRSDTEQGCYLPHHPVVKETSSTTKVRVVFNASCHTSNGQSLNDNLLVGPKLQQDLSAIMLRWRLHRYVMIADAEKMFRQIRVTPAHAQYQIILWRPTANESVKPYQLDTVTYGTACAPYLALRVIYQLASDEEASYPLASKALREDTYVDDLVFGSSSIVQTRRVRDEILNATSRGCFAFRKWIANDSALVTDLPIELRDNAKDKEFIVDESKRVLGIFWRTTSDQFEYSVLPEKPSTLTKRAILSYIAQLYDPLGWISPVVIVAKIYMQQLWTEKIGWDERIAPALQKTWSTFVDDLTNLTSVAIPRWIDSSPQSQLQLHVFCDASQHAYAAAVYVRVANGDKISTQLLVSKTKVAPLKSITIPRLELCAAELGSRLLMWTQSSLKQDQIESFAWSDSSVTLAWLANSPTRWKVFVANRVARIQTRSPLVPWQHVPTDTNPADIASRGCSARELADSDLWWHGPPWLRQPSDQWPDNIPETDATTDIETRALNVHVTTQKREDYAQRCSDWGRLIRAAAIFVRFKTILIRKIRHEGIDDLVAPSRKLLFEFTEEARSYWLREAQESCFANELALIRTNGHLPHRNRLIALNPYLDNKGILRVGGRLEHADLCAAEKHPILLGNCHVTKLIIRQAHQRTLHGGASLTSRLLAETYWIFRVKSQVKNEIRRCVQCVRHRATTLSQEMAPIPSLRVNRRRAFENVGVDYAGPIMVKFGSGRGHESHKLYIAVFVCMTTRAIHLELVHSYSTDAFLAAFKRFTSRRGLPSLVISDNGTNFKGASRELSREFVKAMRHPAIASTLALERIEWRFIPPGSPHFGGMWEAGVKSVKHHLRRVAGDRTLNVEEFSTLLCQIEACLNSRPIAGFSSDPDDLSYLTPGHFLIGTTLLAPPESSLLEVNETRLSRWQTVQSITEQFWRIWSSDYLRSLQTRVKWRTPQPNVEPGAIVLIKDENLPPAKWALGRVLSCHAGSDGRVRVCDIRTAVTTLTRPIHKLCLLPIDDNPDNDNGQGDPSNGN